MRPLNVSSTVRWSKVRTAGGRAWHEGAGAWLWEGSQGVRQKGLPCHATLCHALAMPCHIMPCHAMPRHAMPM